MGWWAVGPAQRRLNPDRAKRARPGDGAETVVGTGARPLGPPQSRAPLRGYAAGRRSCPRDLEANLIAAWAPPRPRADLANPW